jgi:hypothetical protein
VLYDRDGLVISDGCEVRQRSLADDVRGPIHTGEERSPTAHSRTWSTLSWGSSK